MSVNFTSRLLLLCVAVCFADMACGTEAAAGGWERHVISKPTSAAVATHIRDQQAAQDVVKLAQRLFDLSAQGDIDGLLELLDDDIEYNMEDCSLQRMKVANWAGYKGKAEFLKYETWPNEHMNNINFVVDEIVGMGYTTYSKVLLEGTVKANGKRISERGIVRWQFSEQGKLLKGQDYFDSYSIWENLQP